MIPHILQIIFKHSIIQRKEVFLKIIFVLFY